MLSSWTATKILRRRFVALKSNQKVLMSCQKTKSTPLILSVYWASAHDTSSRGRQLKAEVFEESPAVVRSAIFWFPSVEMCLKENSPDVVSHTVAHEQVPDFEALLGLTLNRVADLDLPIRDSGSVEMD